MASVITFDGVRSRSRLFPSLGDEWSEPAANPVQLALGDATWSFISWGVLAFAGATAAYRGYDAVKQRWFGGSGETKGARRRRR